MALETKEKLIGKNTYKVTQLGAVTGRKVFAKLMGLVGPAMAVAAGEGGVEKALASLFSGLDDANMDYFCDQFAPNTMVSTGGKLFKLSDIFDLHFAGNYGELASWLLFSLEVNFGDFLDVLKSRVVNAPEPAKEASE